jgi:tetratricopeptide (TPR) repeat protein
MRRGYSLACIHTISFDLPRHQPIQKRHLSSNSADDTSKESGGGIAMPDQDVELRLADLQSVIQRHYQRGDYTQALKASKDLAQQSASHFGQDHPATASAYNNMGLMHKLLGDFVEARQYYTSAMRIYAKIVGRDHASYASTLHNLGNLNKSQIHFDTTLKATERLALVEKALEYLEEALSIRQVELGPEHPHTVATQMAIGSTLATQVLYEYRMVERQNAIAATGSSKAQPKKQYVALNSQTITQQQWKAAESHLRDAFQTAIDNPRGRRLESNHNNNKSSKKGKQNKKRPPVSSTQNNDHHFSNMETISAALAGQNLAVFLKSYAMTLEDVNERQEQLQQAKQLYERVLYVRSRLLSADHPDVYATKYSLAEVMDVLGDEEAANALRQEILDTYTPAEEEEQVEEQPKTVVVENTKATVSASAATKT